MHEHRHHRRQFLTRIAAAALTPAVGCGSRSTSTLTILTNLSPDQAQPLLEPLSDPSRSLQPLPEIRWIHPAPGLSLARLLASGHPCDLLLTGSPEDLPSFSSTSPLSIGSLSAPPAGLLIHPDALGLHALLPPASLTELAEPRFRNLIALADPRNDPDTFALLDTPLLQPGGWTLAYATAIRLAANALPIQPTADATLRLLTPNLAAVTLGPRPLDFPPLAFVSIAPGSPRTLALAPQSPNATSARSLLQSLADQGRLKPSPPDPDPSAPLRRDLLGAALVDAHPELTDAWTALIQAGRPPRSEAFLIEPPPWPPASVKKLQRDDPSGTLLDTLLAQICPELEPRGWLLEAFQAPTAPLNLQTLASIARAARGRLLNHPRFRPWLRAEWSAWTRQRYRRVARQARGQPGSGQGAPA